MKLIEPEQRSPRCLSEGERIVIADGLAHGQSVRAIARGLGRSPSTTSRELRRNGGRDGRYRPHRAEHAARARMVRPRLRRLATDTVLAGTVTRLLGQCWSPEQVAHELRVLFAGQRRRWLCVESIYQAIYDPTVGLTRPARRQRRRRRLAGLQRRGRLTAMTMIHERLAGIPTIAPGPAQAIVLRDEVRRCDPMPWVISELTVGCLPNVRIQCEPGDRETIAPGGRVPGG